MALFRRKKKDSVMPEEVRDFYASEHRDRKGMAWVLAIATLLVTFLIAAALFFGGRWIYRTVFDNNDDTSTSQESGEKTAQEESTKSTSDTQTNSGSSSNGSSDSSTGTSGSGTGTSSTNTTQTPVTGPSELVNTGPGDEL